MVQCKATHCVFSDLSSYYMCLFYANQTKLAICKIEQMQSSLCFTKSIVILVNFSQHIHLITSSTQGHLNRFIGLPTRLNCYYHILNSAVELIT